MEIQKSQKKNLEKNQKKYKKNQILGCFLKILKIAKNPGFDSFLMFFWLFFDFFTFGFDYFLFCFWFFNLSLF